MEKKRTVTIHDIARQAGVSPSTVSRVLNDTTPVAANKRSAVLAAIEELGYRPNLVAQGLARNRSLTIGVLTPDIASPFFGDILRGIEQGLDGTRYHPVFASGKWRTDEEIDALDVLIDRRVDGLIVLSGGLPDTHLHRVAKQLPLVLVGRSLAGLEAQCLRVDDCQSAQAATRYLIDLGHRRIAHITGLLSHQDALDRRTGYRRALHEAGLPFQEHLEVEGSYSEQSGLLAMQVLLTRGAQFTAIFAGNDQIAYGARLALYRHGIRVPEDVSLVGFDDQPGSAYTTPPLTTMRQPTGEMGIAAAQAVLALLDGKPIEAQIFSTELIVRESAALKRGSRGLHP